MAALWADTPDYYNTPIINRVWTSLTDDGRFTGNGLLSCTVESGTGRRAGTNSIRCDQVGGVPAGNTFFLLERTLAPANNTLIIAFAIQFTSFASLGAEVPFWAVGDATVWHAFLAMRDDHTLIFKRGYVWPPPNAPNTSPVLGATTNPLTTGVWYHFSIKITIDDTAGALSFQINRIEQLGTSGLTGLDTRNGGSAGWSRFAFTSSKPLNTGSLQNPAFRIADVVVCDSSGTGPNADHPGDCAIYASLPSVGNGGNIDFTPSTGTDHGALVDEAVPNDDADYNTGTATGQRDTYVYPALPVTIGTPRFVLTRPCMKLTAAGSTNVVDVVRKAGTNYDGTVLRAPTSGSYTYYDYIREADPSNGLAWTIAGINAAESGVKVL